MCFASLADGEYILRAHHSPLYPEPEDMPDRDLLADTVANLLDVWGDLAPAEALTRALVAERTEKRDMALRWTHVYLACINRK